MIIIAIEKVDEAVFQYHGICQALPSCRFMHNQAVEFTLTIEMRVTAL
jgi:hypothetical protein